MFFCKMFANHSPGVHGNGTDFELPSRELTYPIPAGTVDDFPVPKVGPP